MNLRWKLLMDTPTGKWHWCARKQVWHCFCGHDLQATECWFAAPIGRPAVHYAVRTRGHLSVLIYSSNQFFLFGLVWPFKILAVALFKPSLVKRMSLFCLHSVRSIMFDLIANRIFHCIRLVGYLLASPCGPSATASLAMPRKLD